MFFDLNKYDTIYINNYEDNVGWTFDKHKSNIAMDLDDFKSFVKNLVPKETIDPKSKLYVSSYCSTPRAQIRQNYKCTNLRDKADLIVFPTIPEQSYRMSRYSGTRIIEFENKIYLSRNMTNKIKVDGYRKVDISQCKVLASGHNFVILDSDFLFLPDLYDTVNNNKAWTFENILQRTFTMEPITKEGLSTIVSMLASSDDENKLTAYRILSEMDYVHNCRLVQILFNDHFIHRSEGTVSVKRMIDYIHEHNTNNYVPSIEESNLIIHYNYLALKAFIEEQCNYARDRFNIPFAADIKLTLNTQNETTQILAHNEATGENL